MCRNGSERKNQTVQECKECTGYPTNKFLLGDEKKHRKSNIGKIPSELPERGVSSRWSIKISTVTVAVVM